MVDDGPHEEEARVSTSDSYTKPTVVGIGASAGGLAALKQFFEFIPSDCGLAFVVVVHLSPEHKSHLPDLLQPSVRFPVQQVTDTTPLEANNVYVIPPNANLNTIDTHLRLSKLEEHRRERAPIDHFFRTLASTHDGHSIGVILTGTGSDGTLGLKEIKAKGGLILVQDPNEAEFDGMPQSAIATGLVDLVLPIPEIAAALLRLAQVGPRIAVMEKAAESLQPERVLLPKVLALLKARTERDFSRYKAATILRRIARRMQLNYIDNFEGYLEKLREQPDEARALADDLLITVTSFFRDPDVFKKLEQEIVPKLFEGKGSADSLRVWSVGCATGEEAYSLAMLLLEEAARRSDPPKIQIFASDLHKRSLDGAREGRYPGDIETDVPPERLKRFFQKENGGYRICKEVRDTVVFAPHNLLGDPPFSRLDLITCRNLLIYLDRAVQRDVIDLFHYSLCPRGYLLLGSAETIEASELFRTEEKKLCIYQKRNVPAPEPRLPVFPLTHPRIPGGYPARTENGPGAVAYHSLHQNLLERYAPPSILVGPDNKLVHLSEHAGRYLVHPGGEVTSSVLQLVREELRIELQALLQSTRDTNTAADSKPIAVRFNGHKATVVMHVRPAQDAEQDGFVLVIFDEHNLKRNDAESDGARPEPASEAGQEAKRIAELESELNAARQRLQTIIEEYETSQEEMKASNEEMQSTNEELRSTMEELETSKEELQSINEELQTVNQENRHKVEELSQLSSDLHNLLSATDIATLFLDRDLRILRFTPRLAELFNIRMTDRGRPISDLTHRLGYGQLRQDAQTVLERLIPVEREIRDDAGRWYLTRVLPYRSTEDRIEGVVITFIEITSRKLAEAALRESEAKYRQLVDFIPAAVYACHKDGTLVYYNAKAAQLWGQVPDVNHKAHRLSGSFRTFLPDGTLLRPEDLPMANVLVTGQPVTNQELRIERPDGSTIDILVNITALRDEEGRVTGAINIFQDISERRKAEISLAESEARLRAVLEGIPQLVWRAHDEGQWIWASSQWRTFTGQSDAESQGSGWLNAIHPDDRERTLQSWREAPSHGQLDVEYRIRRVSDGAYIWHHTRSVPVREATGKILEWLGTSTDIEDLKRAEAALSESEQRFRLFVQNVQEYALLQTDLEGHLTSWNPGAERLFGFKSGEVLGQALAQLTGTDEEQEEKLNNEISRARQGERQEDAQWLKRKDGSKFWARWVSEPIYDDAGGLIGLAKVLRDETEREAAQEIVRKSLAEKDQLLKEVHHRVKNNLQVITSLLNLQARQIKEPAILSLFEESRNRVQSIASIHELLYRSDSFATIKLAAYARQIVPDLVRFYGLQEIVETEISGDDAALELERAIPYGLLLNELVSNACKHAFTPGKPGRLAVQLDHRNGEVELTVQDNGIGLPPGFDYQRATSLGLHLVRNLTRQLRGTLEITSGSGVTVRVRFPDPQAITETKIDGQT